MPETPQPKPQEINQDFLGPKKDGYELMPTQDGELLDDGFNDKLSDLDLPVAAMAHEPWTLEEIEDDDEDPDDAKDNPDEADEDRIDEIKQDGSTESDAHAEEHDDFWGKTSESDGGGGEDDPTEPEKITSPELEVAEAKVKEARDELARMKAGRESSTFFSLKFSKSKLEAAEAAYDEAVTDAGAIAVDLLREKGFEGQELVGAIYFGALWEVTSLVNTQFEIEKDASEGTKLKFFYDWWKKQGVESFSFGTIKKGALKEFYQDNKGALKGMFNKSAAMGAIGGTIGVGTAIVAAPLLAGSGLAAGAGLVASRSIGKGLVGNAVRRKAEAETVAEGKRDFRNEQAQAIYDDLLSRDEAIVGRIEAGTLDIDTHSQRVQRNISKKSHDQTAEVKLGNDKRAGASMIIAAGAAVFSYAIADKLADKVSDFWSDSPKPSGGSTPESTGGMPDPTYDSASAGADRMIGITSARPDAANQANQFFENIPSGTPDTPQLDQINELWQSVSDQLNPEQSSVYNQVIGRLSTTEGYGNQWTLDHADEILSLVKQDDSADEVVDKLLSSA